jgi:hypothetical protein
VKYKLNARDVQQKQIRPKPFWGHNEATYDTKHLEVPETQTTDPEELWINGIREIEVRSGTPRNISADLDRLLAIVDTEIDQKKFRKIFGVENVGNWLSHLASSHFLQAFWQFVQAFFTCLRFDRSG